MNCPSCGHDNRPGRKFCVTCGAALPLPCPACGADCEVGENFCGECGEPLAAAAPPRSRTDAPGPPPGVGESGRGPFDAGARRVVTIVFADLVGSTALHERVDAESARRLMERYYLALRRAVEEHGGTVVKLLGDGVMAAFGLHRVSEDDALRAVRGAAAMQDAFRDLVRTEGATLGSVGLRVAVNTGEVVVAAGEDDVVGDPVNIAARLQEQGRDGDVVLGESTRRLVSTRVTLAPLGSIALKGRAEAVAAHRLVSLEPPAGAAASPFVGREAELARIERVFDAAVTTPATRLIVLVGSPGLGKSRLIDEVVRRHTDDAAILTAHCDAASGATFAPLAQALRRFLGLADGATGELLRCAVASALAAGGDDGECARIAAGIDGLLTGAPTSPEETFFVVRRFLAGLAAERPVVLVVDDLHWAEPLLLDLVEHLVQWGGGVPLFVLVGARPELRELRSSLVTPGGGVSEVVMLGGLDAGAAMRLAAGVIGAADLPATVAAKVLATSEGNPLFVGELVRMLVQEGALTRDGDRWTVGASLAALEMPPTIHALLAARIERLRPDDRTVLECAAVVGRHFSRSAVAALCGREAGDLDARLESLRRSELIERDHGWFLGEPALRFHHVLIRDAAYRRLLKHTRAELHRALADWIENRAEGAPEHDETIGWHLEQAHQLLGELGPLDAAAVELGARAARRLTAAGRRALARDDVALAAGLFGRALVRLATNAPERADVVLDWCEALLAAGDVVRAAEAVAELDRIAGRSADGPVVAASSRAAGDAGHDAQTAARRLRCWHTCFAGQLAVLTAPEELHAVAQQVGAAAGELAALDDAAGEAKAHFVFAQALARLGRIGPSEAALDHALAAARRAGDRRRANAVLAGAPLAALWGPSPVTRASGRCLDVVRVLRITQGAPAVEAVALSCQGVLEALRGRIDAARRMLATSRTMVEELGIAHRLHETDVFAGRIDLLEGDAAAAARVLRSGYEGLRDLGLGIDAARAAALLGRALLAQDRAAEAEALSHESERLAGDDLQAAIAWRGVRAEALARRGEHASAIALAGAAVAIAEATDALLDHADARLALAAALRAGGRPTEADTEERRALELWEAKGATVLAERARRGKALSAALPDRGAPAAPRSAGVRAAARRFLPNRASETALTINAAIEGREAGRFRELVSEAYLEIDHPTGASYGHEGCVESVTRLLRSRDAVCRTEPQATLGDALALCRRRVSSSATDGARFDVGPYEHETWTVVEVDARGLLLGQEAFAADHLADALVRLYRRHAELLPDGPARSRAAGTASAYRDAMRIVTDPELAATAIHPDFESIDHRHMSGWSMRGADAYLAHGRGLHEVADNIQLRVVDVLSLHPNAQLVRVLHTGTDRAGGGTYERPFLRVFANGPDGRIVRAEWFDDDREAEALARFDALVRDGEPLLLARRSVAPTAATASIERFNAAVAARDIEALGREFADDIEVIHHATGASYGHSGMVATWRSIFRAARLERRGETLAALGDHLALGYHTMILEGFVEDHLASVGTIETEEAVVFEIDPDGRIRRLEIFPAERLGAAIVRMFERWADRAPDAATAVQARGIADTLSAFEGPRDFDRIAATYPTSVGVVDRRLLGSWSAGSREEVLDHWRGQFALADDLVGRTDEILALAPDTILTRLTYFGNVRASGGRYENVFLCLSMFDADGRYAGAELFEPEDRAAALARFHEPVGLPDDGKPHPFANRATRTMDRFVCATGARDWQAVADLFATGMRFDDRRPLLRMELSRDGFLEQFRTLFDVPHSRWSTTLLGTRGAGLALLRLVLRGTVPNGGGELEIEHICLAGCEVEGLFGTIVLFEAGQMDAAWAEIDRMDAAGDGAMHPMPSLFGEAIARRDWDGIAAMCAPGFVEYDHRSLAVLGTTRGPVAWVNNFRTLVELAPDTVARVEHGRHCPRGLLGTLRWTGTRDGGAYEMIMVGVNEFDQQGRLLRVDFYDPEQIEQARARFAELAGPARPEECLADAAQARVAATGRTPSGCRDEPPPAGRAPGPDPLDALIRPSLATAAMERWSAAYDTAFDTGDWGTVHATLSPECTFDDRRRLALVRGGGELMVASLRERAVSGARFEWTVIGGLGDRIVAGRVLWTGGPSDGRFEIEYLAVVEVDEAGLVLATVLFDVPDAGDAQREAFARWLAIDPRYQPLSNNLEIQDAWNRMDLDGIGRLLAEDVEVNDRRRTGTGRLRGREVYLRSVAALWELAPHSKLDTSWIWLTCTPRGGVSASRRSGALPGGGEFTSDFLSVVHLHDGLATHIEFFEVDAAEAALARFAEIERLEAGSIDGAAALRAPH